MIVALLLVGQPVVATKTGAAVSAPAAGVRPRSPGGEADCDLISGQGCVLPPPGPGRFYPFWTLGKVRHGCVWEFGQTRNGTTFGGFRQYGSVNPSTMGGFASAIRPNPRRCG